MTATLADPSVRSARQGMLRRLAAALEGLGRRAVAQREMLHAASALAPRAEAAAIRARLLAFGCADGSASLANALAADIGGLATEAGSLAAKAERAAAAGEAASGAIAGHAAALAALAADPRAAADPSRLRRLFAPLVATLDAVPAQRVQQAAIGADLARLADRSRPLADRAMAVASQAGEAAGVEALRLSRDLGSLAAEAGRLADAIEGEKAAGGQDPVAVTGAIRGITAAGPLAHPGAPAAAPLSGALAPVLAAAPDRRRRALAGAPLRQGRGLEAQALRLTPSRRAAPAS